MSALTLDQAKKHLNIAKDVSDDELQTVIDAAEAVVSKYCGPLEPVTTTSRVACRNGTAVLPVAPVLEVTSVSTVDSLTPVDLDELHVDLAAGVIDWTTSWAPRSYDVVYTAGRTSLPADLLMAVKEMTRHLWRTQRGGAQRPGAAADGSAPGYLVPNMVAALIESHQIRVGIT
jgi:hypothetical protein